MRVQAANGQRSATAEAGHRLHEGHWAAPEPKPSGSPCVPEFVENNSVQELPVAHFGLLGETKLSHKRISFAHEREIRAVIFYDETCPFGGEGQNGLVVPIDVVEGATAWPLTARAHRPGPRVKGLAGRHLVRLGFSRALSRVDLRNRVGLIGRGRRRGASASSALIAAT
jgi:hypothetical protein